MRGPARGLLSGVVFPQETPHLPHKASQCAGTLPLLLQPLLTGAGTLSHLLQAERKHSHTLSQVLQTLLTEAHTLSQALQALLTGAGIVSHFLQAELKDARAVRQCLLAESRFQLAGTAVVDFPDILRDCKRVSSSRLRGSGGSSAGPRRRRSWGSPGNSG